MGGYGMGGMSRYGGMGMGGYGGMGMGGMGRYGGAQPRADPRPELAGAGRAAASEPRGGLRCAGRAGMGGAGMGMVGPDGMPLEQGMSPLHRTLDTVSRVRPPAPPARKWGLRGRAACGG